MLRERTERKREKNRVNERKREGCIIRRELEIG